MRHLGLWSRLGFGVLLALMLVYSAAPAATPLAGSSVGISTANEARSSVAAAQTGLKGPAMSMASRGLRAPLGTNTIIVILVEFTDMAHSFTEAQVAGVAIGDLNAYYEEASYNQTHITGATTTWLSLPHNRQYFVLGTSSPSEPLFSLVEHAIAAADPSVNFAAYDGVTIVHAGQGQELSGDWRDYWSSEFWGFTIPTNDGVEIHRASVSPEVGLPGSLAYVGVIAHEFGHDLGLPDLYDTDYTGAQYVSHWCLMGEGSWNGPNRVGESPAHMMGWCKLQLGYVNGSQLLQATSATSVVVDPLENPTTGVHLVKIAIDSTHYYLIEVRQQIGYDQWLRGKGVVLSYVDETLATGKGIVKVVDSHPATATKDDGAFDVGPGAVSSYVSAPGQFSMFVENAIGNSYNITILRAWVKFLNPLDGSAVLTSAFPIEWNGSAAAPGIDHYELFFDGSLVYSGSGLSHNLTGVAAGLHNATLVMVLLGSGRRLTIQSRFVVDLVPPTIHSVFNVPTAPGFGDAIQVVVNVTDDTWIVNATLYYRRSGDPVWYHLDMLQYSGAEWRAILGTFFPGVTVTYYVTVYDAGGRIQTDDNAGSYYSFAVSGLGLIIYLIIGGAIGLAVLLLVCRSIQKRRRGAPASEHVWAPPTSSPPLEPSQKQAPTDYAEPSIKTSFCFSCGAPLTPGATYCPYCGRPVAE
jgi:M6 family metalloprotease-like protein